MADAPRLPDAGEFPEALAQPARQRPPQLVWIVPVVAALIGGWLAVKAVLERGPTITITFKSAEGLEAGKTKLKFKDVDIGVVSAIVLSPDRKAIVATAELSRQAESLLVEDTRFWVVRARIAAGQVSGLSTLLSGSYIGVDPGRSAKTRRDFTGLEVPPIVTGDVPGRHFTLRAADLGALDIGSPVYFRRVRVGEVVASDLDQDGKGVSFRIFVYAPHDQYVTANTRFWNASGIDIALDVAGLRVRTESLVSVLFGGIAFQAPPDAPPASPANADAVFPLHPDRDDAFRRPDTTTESYVLLFDQSVRGLSVGAPVDFHGVVVGEVTRVTLEADPAGARWRTPVEVRLYPERLPARRRDSSRKARPDERAAALQRFVDRGFRAQLRTGNLLTGQLYVALDFFPNAAKVKVDPRAKPLEIPTVPGSFEELQNALATIVKKLEKVPFDQLAADLQRAVRNLDRTMQDVDKLVQRLDTEVAPELRATLDQARKALEAGERTLAADSPVQAELREALREVSRAAAAVRSLADYLDRHPEAIIRGKQEERP